MLAIEAAAVGQAAVEGLVLPLAGSSTPARAPPCGHLHASAQPYLAARSGGCARARRGSARRRPGSVARYRRAPARAWGCARGPAGTGGPDLPPRSRSHRPPPRSGGVRAVRSARPHRHDLAALERHQRHRAEGEARDDRHRDEHRPARHGPSCTSPRGVSRCEPNAGAGQSPSGYVPLWGVNGHVSRY